MTREYVVKVTDKFVPNAFQQFESEWSPEQEIVRCKDCTEYQEWNDGKICMRLGSYYGDVPPNWFCADGKRKDK